MYVKFSCPILITKTFNIWGNYLSVAKWKIMARFYSKLFILIPSQANFQWYDYKSGKGARQELISSQCTLKYYACGFDVSKYE